MWEVFDPRTGITIFTTYFRPSAMLLAWWYNLDYEKHNEGWLE